MNLIIWLVVGGVIGWVASLIMKTDAQQGLFLNIVVGIVGALIGGWLLSPMVGAGTLNQGDFSLPGHPNVFAIGDIAALTDANGKPVPGVAQGAIQPGVYVAKAITEEIFDGPAARTKRAPFAYFDKGNMATIGRRRAIAEIGKLHLTGFPAWMAWLGLHLFFLIGFRNRISVLVQWIYAYFMTKRGARIIMGLGDNPAAGNANSTSNAQR